jgi:CheY-like chemotaxis protein
MRILYVEDNLANLALVQRLARIGNHEIISHPDGEAALAHFQQDKPDLILMDIQLKGALNGLDVVKKLREQGHKTPIIAVTAYAMLGDRERCLQAGCNEYLPKPLPVEQLVEFFERFDPKRAAPAVVQTAPTVNVPEPKADGAEKQSVVTVSLPPTEKTAGAGNQEQVATTAPPTMNAPVANGDSNPGRPEIKPDVPTSAGNVLANPPAPNHPDSPVTAASAGEPTPEIAKRPADTDIAGTRASQNTDEQSDTASSEPPAAGKPKTTPG